MDVELLLQEINVILDLGLPGWTHVLTDPASLWIKTIAALLGQTQMGIQSLEGSGQGNPLRVAYLGSRRHQDYISDIAFDTPPSVQEVARTTLFNLHRTITALRVSHDLIVVELPYPILLKLSGWDGFTTMPWLQQRLELNGCWEDLTSRA